MTTSQPPPPNANGSVAKTAPKRKKLSSHWLYVAVIVAVVAGTAVGLIFGKDAAGLAVIGTAFVNLIKMMIGPIIFCTIVLGIGSVRKASQVGKVGGYALLYFVVMSTFALFLGLLVGNLIHPGEGLQAAAATATYTVTGARIVRELHHRHHPHHVVLRADRRLGAAGPVRRVDRRLRCAGDGQQG